MPLISILTRTTYAFQTQGLVGDSSPLGIRSKGYKCVSSGASGHGGGEGSDGVIW